MPPSAVVVAALVIWAVLSVSSITVGVADEEPPTWRFLPPLRARPRIIGRRGPEAPADGFQHAFSADYFAEQAGRDDVADGNDGLSGGAAQRGVDGDDGAGVDDADSAPLEAVGAGIARNIAYGGVLNNLERVTTLNDDLGKALREFAAPRVQSRLEAARSAAAAEGSSPPPLELREWVVVRAWELELSHTLDGQEANVLDLHVMTSNGWWGSVVHPVTFGITFFVEVETTFAEVGERSGEDTDATGKEQAGGEEVLLHHVHRIVASYDIRHSFNLFRLTTVERDELRLVEEPAASSTDALGDGATASSDTIPATMRGVLYREYGGADALEVVNDLAVPACGKLDVVIQSAAAGVNPVDYKLASGMIKAWPQTLPIVPGWDIAGRVVAVGDSVDGLEVGDEVWTYLRPAFDMADQHPESSAERIDATTGAYAEYATVKAWKVGRKPASLDSVVAAAVPLAALTAWQGLFEHGSGTAGQTVLILAASGGVGSFAVQFAKALGMTVIGTCSARNVDYVRSLGADQVVDYNVDGGVAAALKDTEIDLVLDCVGGENTKEGIAALKTGGRIVTMASSQLDELLATEPTERRLTGTGMLVHPSRSDLDAIASLFDRGLVSMPPVSRLPLEDAAEAMRRIATRRTVGKMVLTMQQYAENATVEVSVDATGAASAGTTARAIGDEAAHDDSEEAQHAGEADQDKGTLLPPREWVFDRPASADSARNVTIVCYNVWNSNPPHWLYPHYEQRLRRYKARMELLARYIREASPDIIGLQEVRYDSTLGFAEDHAQINELSSAFPEYQFVFQPASSYFSQDRLPHRDEEGPAIMSRWPIVSSDHILLSRDISDSDDGHQRLCLHAVVAVPGGHLVDVYVTHLSLSERARNRTAVEIWDFIQATRHGDVQLFLGDLNAEPDTKAIQFFQGEATLHDGARERRTSMRDVWLELHEEPEPRSGNEEVRYNALTFPSDNPVKRIDLILAGTPTTDEEAYGGGHGSVPDWLPRAAEAACGDGGATIQFPRPRALDVHLIGQDASPETQHLVGVGDGMVAKDSPLFASDHRGVVAVLELQPAQCEP